MRSGGYQARRIQKTGGATFIVSLPKKWVVEQGLGAGDLLSFAPGPDGSLTVQAEPRSGGAGRRRTVALEPDGAEEHLLRRLIAEYIAGATYLEVRSPDRLSPQTRETVRRFAQRMIGPEILEETAEAVILQDVIGENPLPLPSVLRRMYQMVRSMQSDALAALEEPDPTLARDVVERDWDVDRLHWFIQRQVSSALRDVRSLVSLKLTLPECATYLAASRVLERIADHAVRISGTVERMGRGRLPPALLRPLGDLARRAAEGLSEAMASLERADVSKANAVVDAMERLESERESILRSVSAKPGRLVLPLAQVVESLVRSALYAADLAEVAINHAVETERGLPEEPGRPSAGPRP